VASTYLVVGGAGFVGSSLAIAFKRDYENLRVICLDNLKRRGSELNIPRLLVHGIDFVHGDVRNKEDLKGFQDIDVILDCSAEPSVLAGQGSSCDYVIGTNLYGTINCLEVARASRADFVFLSTSRVYPIGLINGLKYREASTRFELADEQEVPGATTRGFSEALPLSGARSFYGTTKLCSELLVGEYIDLYGIRGVINRCGVIAGPWQMGKVDQGFVTLWVARHVFGGPLAYIGFGGTGKQVRDVLHIDDLYRLLETQLRGLGRFSGMVFNVGGGQAMSVSPLELTEICAGVTERRIPIASIAETRAADVRFYVSDNLKVEQATGWKPTRTVSEIVEDIAGWVRAYERDVRPILGCED